MRENKIETFATQRRIKEQNRQKIMKLLDDKPRTFTDLLKWSGFSPAGLTKMLSELVHEKRIKKGKERKSPYELANKYRHFKETIFLGNTVSEIWDSGGKYNIDLSDHISAEMFLETKHFPFGLMSHLFLDKEIEKLNPFLNRDVFDIERYIFEKILDNVKKRKIKIDESKSGRIVLGFEINYSDLVKAVKSYTPLEHKKFVKKRMKHLESKQK